MKRILQHVNGLNGLILILYCTCITFAHSLATKNIYAADSNFILLLDVCNTLLITFFVMLIICPLIIKFFEKKELRVHHKSDEKVETKKYTVLFFLSSFAIMMLYYVGYYPGSFMVDSFMQYGQATTGAYNDWHPFLHTLLSVTVPLLISGGWYGSIVLIQCIAFSAIITYALRSLLVHTNKKFNFATMLFILLNPQTGNIAIFVGKDSSFAIIALLLATFAMNVCFTNGDWAKKPINAIAFIVTAVIATMIRHNAVLFTAPLFIGFLFFVPKKKAVVFIMSFLVLIVGIKGPLYNVLNVEAPGRRQVEMLGLPLTAIGAVVKYDYDSLDEETKTFAMEIAPKEVWEKYEYGDFNTVKFASGTNLNAVEEKGVYEVLKITLKCFVHSPKEALRGVLKLTDSVYTIADDHHHYNFYFLSDNDFGVRYEGNHFVKMVLDYYNYFACEVFAQVFSYVGVMHLLLLSAVLSKYKLNKWTSWKRIALILPLFIYNFGTMLLLTRADDSARFFYYTFLITPILLAIIFKNKTVQENN